MATLAAVPGKNVSESAQEQEHAQTYSVGTRKSKLALVQTDLVVQALTVARPDYKYEIRARDTAAGDIDKVTPFKDMPVKNIWTHELEALLIEGNLDILVHSLKDVPTNLPPNCEIGATIQREDPRDAFVLKAGRKSCTIADLPVGSVIGTSSIRRTAQIALRYPHLVIKDVRGNVGTRLAKLDAEDGRFDALILAAAGLLRLDLGDRITQFLDSENGGMLYAVGQGAIGIENRSDDEEVKSMLAAIDHNRTTFATTAERTLLKIIEGGCSAPLGVESSWIDHTDGQVLRMKAIVVSTDGKQSAEVDEVAKVRNKRDAEGLGSKVASLILERGADRILAGIKAKKPTTVIDLEDK